MAKTFVEWIAQLDDRTTAICMDAHGQVVEEDELFVTMVGALESPPAHWGCRSILDIRTMTVTTEVTARDRANEGRRFERSERRAGRKQMTQRRKRVGKEKWEKELSRSRAATPPPGIPYLAEYRSRGPFRLLEAFADDTGKVVLGPIRPPTRSQLRQVKPMWDQQIAIDQFDAIMHPGTMTADGARRAASRRAARRMMDDDLDAVVSELRRSLEFRTQFGTFADDVSGLADAIRASDELREKMEDLVARKVGQYMDSWAGSSDGVYDHSTALQVIAGDKYGTTGQVFADMWTKLPEQTQAAVRDLIAREKQFVERMLDTIQETTEQFLAEAGITELHLSRGVGWDRGSVPDEIFQLSVGESASVTMDQRALSSWSMSESIATKFARGIDEGFLIQATVPIEHVMSYWRTGFGTLWESEVVVKVFPGQVRVTRMN